MLVTRKRPDAQKGLSRDNPKVDYVIPVTDSTAKTSTWQFLPYRADFPSRPLSNRQSWFAFSDLPLNTRDEFACLNALSNVQDERSSRPNIPAAFSRRRIEPAYREETDSLQPIRGLRSRMHLANRSSNRAYRFRCMLEPWFILNGFHPPVEASPVFAFSFVKTSGGSAALF
jgi:hypothetical protein